MTSALSAVPTSLPWDRAEPDGTTTLFAALNVLDGTVPGRCMQRHGPAASRRHPSSEGPPVRRPARRHRAFIRFLDAIEAALPAGKPIHAILDNDATHKHPESLPSGYDRG